MLEYFLSLDIPIREVYGMSECGGPQTGNTFADFRLGTCGVRFAGTRMKIAEDGEICYQGRNTFMGYFKEPKLSAEAIDDEGWLHSGDIGVLLDDKWLKITGRKKELLITAGGENVAPVLIEDCIKKELEGIVANVMAVGDRQKYLTAVVTLSAKPKDPRSLAEGEYPFTSDLSDRCLEACRAAGSAATTVDEAIVDPALNAMIEAGIKRANKLSISNAHHIQKFVLVPADFSLEGNELTPTMKLKRRIVLEKYSNELQALYGDDWKS